MCSTLPSLLPSRPPTSPLSPHTLPLTLFYPFHTIQFSVFTYLFSTLFPFSFPPLFPLSRCFLLPHLAILNFLSPFTPTFSFFFFAQFLPSLCRSPLFPLTLLFSSLTLPYSLSFPLLLLLSFFLYSSSLTFSPPSLLFPLSHCFLFPHLFILTFLSLFTPTLLLPLFFSVFVVPLLPLSYSSPFSHFCIITFSFHFFSYSSPITFSPSVSSPLPLRSPFLIAILYSPFPFLSHFSPVRYIFFPSISINFPLFITLWHGYPL